MSTVSAQARPKIKRISMPTKGLAKWSTLGPLLEKLLLAQGLRISIDGAESATDGEGEVHFTLTPPTGALHPWKCSVVGGDLVMSGGSYNGTPVSGATLTGTGWAWLAVEYSLTVEDDWVVAASLTSVTVDQGSTVPTNDGDAGEFYIALVQFDSGAVLSQAATNSISATVCDDGSGTGTAELNIIQS